MSIKSLWTERSTLERLLIAFTCLLIIIVILISQRVDKINDYEKTHCLTKQCIKSAAAIIEHIDPFVSPCEDFFQFACGGWIKKNPIPSGQNRWYGITQIRQGNEFDLKNLLEQANKAQSKAEKKAKDYYLSCIDTDGKREALGAKPLVSFIESVGGWSVSGKFDVKEWSLQNILQSLQNEYSVNALFSWNIMADPRNNSRNVFYIVQPRTVRSTISAYRNSTKHAKMMNTYLDYMTTVGVLLGGESTSTKERMQEILDFEKHLTLALTQFSSDPKGYNNPISIAKLQTVVPYISWLNYFHNITNSVNKTVSNETIIINATPAYFISLNNLLKEYTKSDEKKTILNNYLIWKAVDSFVPLLSESFRTARWLYDKVIYSKEGREEDWRVCVNDVAKNMEYAISAIFVRETFSEEENMKVANMIDEIKDAIVRNFDNIEWMDEETREKAKEKASAVTNLVGFPDYILDPYLLDEQYENLTINPDDYFSNHLRALKHNNILILDKFDKPADKQRWDLPLNQVNAAYVPTKNHIEFPAAFLKFPFFEDDRPDSLNYGGVGTAIGHELTHAFDNQGQQFDMHGNFGNWWKNETLEEFVKKSQCFIKQYSQFTLAGHSIDGRRTLAENIADNGGIKAAYYAFLTTQRDTKEDFRKILPSVHFDNHQLFFIGYAQSWCSTSTFDGLTLQIHQDIHSPEKVRVNVPLSNFKEFSEVFDCPIGSNMNPVNKCEVW